MAEADLLSSQSASGTSGGAHADADRRARRLAYLTVCVPAAGFVLAIAYTWTFGVRAADFVLLAVMYFATALGVETGMHRYFSHRAFKGHPIVTVLLGVLGSMAAQGPILFWAATHRMHHAFTDQDGDPHSPRPKANRDGRASRLYGLWHGHVGWLFTVRRDNWNAFATDLLRDRLIVNLNLRYGWWVALGLALPAAAGALFAPSGHVWIGVLGGFLWGGLARIFLLDQSTWAVNSLCHTIGTRPYQTRDHSRNLGVLALFSVGGAWHNNHHAHPALANNDHEFWQLDPSAWFIRLLDSVGLVTDVRYASKQAAADASSSR
ncbi:acyl-CoA desaturase [Burkholderia singularis]|uniref:Fatty acid desaturase Delta-9 fatty acid desaturase n=1 Tax=Burkholderia singularis TaxID=1503053 RepID=A0A238H3C3_9BURK|nr:acyl-CoA desaturase [Burkholderia singularis]SMF99779.1 Fatty acid desaturase; Delta-9 fatty acid desaturase [Burkholderia singularis]